MNPASETATPPPIQQPNAHATPSSLTVKAETFVPHPVKLAQAATHQQQPQPHARQHSYYEMSSSDDDVFTLSFSRGDQGEEYLNDCRNSIRATQSSGTPGEGGSDSLQSDKRTIAKCIQGCGRKERGLITADKWMDHSTLAVVDGKRGLEVGSTWRKFMDAFMNVFFEKAKTQMISSFDELRQTSKMAAFVPRMQA